MKKRGFLTKAICICLLLLLTATACKPPQNNGGAGNNNTGNNNPGGSGSEDNKPGGDSNMNDLSHLTVNTGNTPLKLWYDEEAPFDNEGSPEASMMAGQDIGWQNWSMPIGNGFFGANVFGRVETERVQITEKTLANPWQLEQTVNGVTSWPQVAGLNNFSETYIDFNHTKADVTNYYRDLDLRTSIASTSYKYDGATYTREYFVSYPDKALVIRLDATDGPLSFTLRPTIPFEQSYMNNPSDGLSKFGTVTSTVENGVGCIELSGTLGYYDVDFVGYYRVYTTGGSITSDTVQNRYMDSDGKLITDNDGVIRVEGAESAIIVATFGTDYELCPENFANGQYSHNKQTAKTNLDDARAKVGEQLDLVVDAINGKTVDEAYKYLKDRHLKDYQELFNRVDLDLNFNDLDLTITTDELLAKYNRGIHSSYLEALLFQYGRYLIIASSREGSLPANLQGVWNCYNVPAWTSGYWSNINIQMNYWHVFSTNLAETFIPYVDYNAAYMPEAEKHANNVINKYNPSVSGQDGGNGWTMGIAGNPFFVNQDRSCGNLGLLTQVFYEYYEFTKDEEVLELVYDVLANAARFVTKCVKEYDGLYLVEYCDSPEMYVNGVWYYTTGTTYAQTLAYINNYAALQCAKEMGIDLKDVGTLASNDFAVLSTILDQLDKYDPINVGLSGQIKEFREEDYYGSLGNPNHRHISQLVGLFPGNLINSSTDAWIDAALVTLAGRNDGLTDWPNGTTNTNEASIVAWAWAHKQALYARCGEGDLAQEMLAGNLRNSTLQNLLMVCGKIFQIEASSGTTAAIAEMLLQSDEGFIEILPAIPTNWDKGAYTGLVARGNFEVSVEWEDSVATKINILSNLGGKVSLKYPAFHNVTICNSRGENVAYEISDNNVITFMTSLGETYYISGFKKVEKVEKPLNFGFYRVNYSDFKLTWNEVAGAEKYNIYVAYENDPSYTFIGSTSETSYLLTAAKGMENVRKTFVVTAVNKEGTESNRTLCYSNPISTDLELYSLSWSEADGKISATAQANEAASKVRLYAISGCEHFLIAEADGLTVTADYDKRASYYLVAVSKYTDEESDPIHLTPGNNSSNLLNGKEKTDTSSDGIRRISFNLSDIYALDELKIYFNGNFSANGLTVERLYNGEWLTIASCKSADEISPYLFDNYLSFAVGGKADKVRITVSYAVGDIISIGDITVTGEKVEGEKVEYNNVFAGKEVIPSTDAAGNIYQQSYGYQTLTDGIIDQEYTGRYSSKQRGGKVEATINLGGVYNLSEFKVCLYKDGISKFGTALTVQVMFGGEWTTVINCESEAELANYLVKNPGGVGDWLVFPISDVYASKVKFTIPSQTSSGWTTFYELECSGVASPVTEPEYDEDEKEDNLNLFKDKEFVPTNAALGQVLVAGWWKGGGYETLTDGNKVDEMTGRFSTVMKASGFMDATMDFGGSYELNLLRFYLYDTKDSITEASKKGSIGNDILIQIYKDGEWVTVVSCSDNASLCEYLVINSGANNDYLEFDLGGVVAEKIRFYISSSASASGTTFQEIECSGKVISVNDPDEPKPDEPKPDEPKPDDPDLIANILAGKQFVPSDDAAGNIYNANYGYQTLTDGIIYQEATGRYSSKQNGGKVEATVDLGEVYSLGEFKVYLYWNNGINMFGSGLKIEVLSDGEWVTAVNCTSTSELQEHWVDNPDNIDKEWLVFDLGGVSASQIRFTIPSQTSAGWTTFYEIECSGYAK